MIFNLIKVSLLDFGRRKYDFLRLALILSVGFSALLATLSLKNQLINTLDVEAKYLLTSDLSIGVRRLITPAEMSIFEKVISPYAHQKSRDITLLTVMNDSKKLNNLLPVVANIKLVESNYPFYSKAIFEKNKDTRLAWKQLHLEQNVYMSKEQAKRYELNLGDTIQILDQNFILKDFILEDAAQGLRFFNLFPTIYISLSNLKKTEIFGPQTTFFDTRHVHWIKPLSLEQQLKIKEQLEIELKDPALKVSLPRDSSDQNKKLWDTVSDFLGILTLSALVLSILGLFTLMRYQWTTEVKMHERFFLMGLTLRERFTIKIVQDLLLCLCATVLTCVIAYPLSLGLESLLPQSLKGMIQVFNLEAISSLVAGLWTVLIITSSFFFFSSKIKFYFYEQATKKQSWFFNFSFLVLSFGLMLLGGRMLTRSWFISFAVLAGLFILYLLLIIAIKVLLYILKNYFKLPHQLNFSNFTQIKLRLLFRSWEKYFSLYATTVGCLGLVYFLLILLLTLQVSLKAQLSFTSDKPDLFLFDLQNDDLGNLKNLVTTFKAEQLALSPLVRGRLIAINGNEVGREKSETNLTREEEEEARFKFRSVNVSYKTDLNAFEKVVKGIPLVSSWKVTNPKIPVPISLEYRYAKRLKVGIGDLLTFDFQGLILKAQIVNLRYVFWLSMHPNFFILFPEGVLNELPQSYLSVLKFPNETVLKNFTSELQTTMPHISQLLLKQTVDLALKQVDLLIKAFVLISILFLILGIFLWLSVIFERLSLAKEQMKLLNTLGIHRKTILQLYLLEFGAMLTLIIIFTPMVAWASAYFLAQEYFDGLLVWPWLKIFYLTIILVVPLSLITTFIVRRFSRGNP